jgi:hypothetical protein
VLFYLHYTAALLLAAEITFLSIVKTTQPLQTPYRWSLLLGDLALVALLCLPAAGNVQSIFARRANWAAFIDREPIWAALKLDFAPGLVVSSPYWRRVGCSAVSTQACCKFGPTGASSLCDFCLSAGLRAAPHRLAQHLDRSGPTVFPAVRGNRVPGSHAARRALR